MKKALATKRDVLIGEIIKRFVLINRLVYFASQETIENPGRFFKVCRGFLLDKLELVDIFADERYFTIRHFMDEAIAYEPFLTSSMLI